MVETLECKKWTLFSMCLVGLVLILVLTIVPSVILENKEPWTEWDARGLRVQKGIVIGMGVLGALFQLVGLFGAYWENFWLTFIYAIISTVATLGSIALGIVISPVYWGTFVFSLFVTILALLYANALYQEK